DVEKLLNFFKKRNNAELVQKISAKLDILVDTLCKQMTFDDFYKFLRVPPVLDKERAKKIIVQHEDKLVLWVNNGFTNQLHEIVPELLNAFFDQSKDNCIIPSRIALTAYMARYP